MYRVVLPGNGLITAVFCIIDFYFMDGPIVNEMF